LDLKSKSLYEGESPDFLLDLISKKTAKYDFSEVYLSSGISSAFDIHNGIFDGNFSSSSKGARIRIMENGLFYNMSTNDLSKSSLMSAISKIKGMPKGSTKLSSEKTVKGKYRVTPKILDEREASKLAYDLDYYLKGYKEVIYREVSLGYGEEETLFENSEGSSIMSYYPSAGLSIYLLIKGKKSTRERILEFGGVGGLEVLDYERITKRISEEIKGLKAVADNGASLSDAKIKSIKNVVISPEISGIAVHESIGHPNESDRVFGRELAQAGSSYINKDNLGMRIGSDSVNIFDYPSIKGTSGFYYYDDEGVKAAKKHIIKNGMQNELLLNREYAGMLKRKSNGSARSSSYDAEPLVRMSNTYLGAGDSSFEELITEAKDGIYVKSFNGWNIDDTRSFSMYQGNEAYLIKKGEISSPILNYRLEKGTLDLWKSVSLLSKKVELFNGECGKGEPLQGVPVTMGGPYALLQFR